MPTVPVLLVFKLLALALNSKPNSSAICLILFLVSSEIKALSFKLLDTVD